MGLSIIKYPPKVSLSGNPVEVTVQTTDADRYDTSPKPSRLWFSIYIIDCTENDEMVIGFSDEDGNSYSLTYTYKATPTGSREYSSIDEFQELLEEEIDLCKFYNITLGEYNTFQIIAKEINSAYNFTFSTDIGNVDYSYTSAQVPVEKNFYRIGCNVWVKNLIDDSTGLSLAAQFFGDPDDDNRVTFDISQYLQKEISYGFTYPELAGTEIIDQGDLLLEYKLEFFEQYYVTTQIKEGYIETEKYYALQGKISDDLQGQYDELSTDWWSQLPTTKQFLTWSPAEKYTFADSQEKLYFLVFDSETSTIKLRAKAYYSDGTYANFDIKTQDCSQFDLYELIVSYIIILATRVTQTCVKYDVWLEDQDDTVISEVKTYVLNSNYYKNKRVFFFRNQLSGYDTVICTGKFSENNNFERHIVELQNRYNTNSVITDKKYKGNTGFSEDKEYKQYLTELQTSREIIEITNTFLYDIIALDESSFVCKDDETLYDLPFTYKRDVIDSLYSPLEIEITIDVLAYSDTEAVDGGGAFIDV